MDISQNTAGWLAGLWIVAIFAFIGGAIAKTRGYPVLLGIAVGSTGFGGMLMLTLLPLRVATRPTGIAPGVAPDGTRPDARAEPESLNRTYGWSIALLWIGTLLLRALLRLTLSEGRWNLSIDAALFIGAFIATFMIIRRWLAEPLSGRRRRSRAG